MRDGREGEREREFPRLFNHVGSLGMLPAENKRPLYRVFNANGKWYKYRAGTRAILTFLPPLYTSHHIFHPVAPLLSISAERTLRFFIVICTLGPRYSFSVGIFLSLFYTLHGRIFHHGDLTHHCAHSVFNNSMRLIECASKDVNSDELLLSTIHLIVN